MLGNKFNCQSLIVLPAPNYYTEITTLRLRVLSVHVGCRLTLSRADHLSLTCFTQPQSSLSHVLNGRAADGRRWSPLSDRQRYVGHRSSRWTRANNGEITTVWCWKNVWGGAGQDSGSIPGISSAGIYRHGDVLEKFSWIFSEQSWNTRQFESRR